ncbi:hypothetical protein EVB97_115 [Rhizobium phage RHph_Y65]|uniref:Uncharacterized protein n=1 Tax=Rhizobium phage RHph_Y65 TaxID=2509785 RepID=A0A7S5R7T5_9CAUD|nr:hypothetical protein PQC17_gp115 [Rhizobium phage RHph_Y65]QIG72673.1 hypothetical protein EVB97_115 [Rhizobium phage RHph_Y65]
MSKDFFGDGLVADEMRSRYGSVWDNLPSVLKTSIIAGLIIGICAGLIS